MKQSLSFSAMDSLLSRQTSHWTIRAGVLRRFQVWPLHFITRRLPFSQRRHLKSESRVSLRMEGLKDEVSAPAVEQRNGMPGIRYANLRLPERRVQRHGVMATKTRHGKPPVASKTANDQPAELRPGFFLLTQLLLSRPAPELLSRPRLADRLLNNLTSPLTLV